MKIKPRFRGNRRTAHDLLSLRMNVLLLAIAASPTTLARRPRPLTKIPSRIEIAAFFKHTIAGHMGRSEFDTAAGPIRAATLGFGE
jgi:hypothetical protein